MKKIHINIPDKIHEALKERAKQNGRSMNAEVVRIFERGLGVIEVPVIGKVTPDGNVEFWKSKAGMDEAAARG